MTLPRASGILLHPTSLPNDYGIGDLGPAAYRFVDFLESAKQSYWQVLPLGPTGYGDSPYQCFSAFAGNTNLISPEVLVEEELLTPKEIESRPDFSSAKVDFGSVIEWKKGLLEKAYQRFRVTTNVSLRASVETFTEEVASWLEEYAIFRAIKKSQDQKLWLEWPEPLRLRDETALLNERESLIEEIRAQKFYQFLFFKQWTRIKNYANGKGIKIIGDLPIFVSLDSADVWCSRNQFKLNEDGSPRVVAGVPPDFFSKTGQRWGNPIYDWEEMAADGFKWWVERVAFALQTVDVIRIDHFRGFAACWEVPGDEETAENGEWVDVPGHRLFERLSEVLGHLPLIAEDLGVMDDNVRGLRDRFMYPGMRILQFAFGGDANNRDLPHNYIRNCAAYTGTHDNDTMVGWFKSLDNKSSNKGIKKIRPEFDFCKKYLNSSGDEIHWDSIRAIWASVADTAIAPMQDLLGLDNKARMNLPATKTANWQWRVTKKQMTAKVFDRLKELTELYAR